MANKPISSKQLLYQYTRHQMVAELIRNGPATYTQLLHHVGGTNISEHVDRLAHGGLIKVTRAFVAKRPRTTISVTALGRQMFADYGRAIDAAIGPVAEAAA
jgi:DNA-binding MarR family transcriptional regulator